MQSSPVSTAYTWCNSQGYDETLVMFVTSKSHILDYFIPYDYIKKARKALVICEMGSRLATQYIDDFKKHLVNYSYV